MSSAELLPITKELYQQMVGIAWLMLGPTFLLSVVLSYIKHSGQVPAMDLLQRVVITIFLLVFFPEITSAIADVANGLADRIGEKQAIEHLFEQIRQQGDPASQAQTNPFLIKNIGVGILSYISYILPFLAKYLMTALYHFLWALLTCVAPLAILCNLFPGLANITKNLFSSLLEISVWNVLWQLMAAMLLGLKFVHPTGNYFDAICFNVLIAIGLVAVPMIVHSFVRSGLSSPSSLSAAGAVAFAMGPAVKTIAVMKSANNARARISRKFQAVREVSKSTKGEK